MTARADALTTLIRSSAKGDDEALSQLLETIYEDLRTIARARRRGENTGGDLQTTALVHEAILKLIAADLSAVSDSAHLMALASRIMRHILVDYARRGQSAKRIGEKPPAEQLVSCVIDKGFNTELLDLDRAIRSLARKHPRLEHVIECRFFGGMSNEETAKALEVSSRTVKRDWIRAKAYLLDSLRTAAPASMDS